MKSRILKLKDVFWAIFRLKTVHNLDIVEYKGEKYSVLYGNPHWELTQLNTTLHNQVESAKLKVIRNLSRDLIRIAEDYKFQMQSWYSIDINYSIFRRISYKNSDNIKFGA